MRMIALLSALSVATSACACERRPPEPTSTRVDHASNNSAGSQVAGKSSPPASAASRCLQPAPSSPPPPAPTASSCPRDPLFSPPQLAREDLRFPDAPGSPTLHVEVAVDPASQQRGLMFRRSMPPNDGMLFSFDGPPRVHTFWMHNTCIPLDMLFITTDGFISGILENVPTRNDAARSVPCPVSHVLETNAGWTRRHGIFAGQHVTLPKTSR